MIWTLVDRPTEIRPGSTLSIPRNTPHSYANLSGKTARILCLQSPGILGPEYYLEIADCWSSGRPDLAGIGAIMSRYGVVPITQPEHLLPAPVPAER